MLSMRLKRQLNPLRVRSPDAIPRKLKEAQVSSVPFVPHVSKTLEYLQNFADYAAFRMLSKFWIVNRLFYLSAE